MQARTHARLKCLFTGPKSLLNHVDSTGGSGAGSTRCAAASVSAYCACVRAIVSMRQCACAREGRVHLVPSFAAPSFIDPSSMSGDRKEMLVRARRDACILHLLLYPRRSAASHSPLVSLTPRLSHTRCRRPFSHPVSPPLSTLGPRPGRIRLAFISGLNPNQAGLADVAAAVGHCLRWYGYGWCGGGKGTGGRKWEPEAGNGDGWHGLCWSACLVES